MIFFRITSYNVCYTKLLRNGLEVHSIERNGRIIKPEAGTIKLYKNDEILMTGNADRLNYILAHPDVKLKGMEYLDNEDPVNLKQYVITSYSIHYTKLYDITSTKSNNK